MATLASLPLTYLETILTQNPKAQFFPLSVTDYPFSTYPQGVPRSAVVSAYQTAASQIGAYNLVLLGGDNFQRANQNPLTSPWVNAPNGSGLQVVNGQCYSLATTSVCAAIFSGLGALPNDQWCSVTIGQLDMFAVDGVTTDPQINLVLRASVAAVTGYRFSLANLTGLSSNEVASGGVGIGTTSGGAVGASNCPRIKTGDVFTAVAVGTLMQFYQNGVLRATLNDASVTSGYPALEFPDTGGFATLSASVASFSCGAAFGGPNLSIS
jgi:hypothetical protein